MDDKNRETRLSVILDFIRFYSRDESSSECIRMKLVSVVYLLIIEILCVYCGIITGIFKYRQDNERYLFIEILIKSYRL